MREGPGPAAAKMLRVFVGEDDRWDGRPLYEAIVERLLEMDLAGATVYRGIAGFGANQRIHAARRLGFSHDAPVMIAVVDRDEKIRAVIPVLDEMVGEGLVVLSDVEVLRYRHGSPGGDDFSLSPPG